VVRQLRPLGYQVIEAANGRQAREIRDGEALVDLSYTDIVMSVGMTGKQLAEEAKQRRPRAKVLFTSGYAQNSIVNQAGLGLVFTSCRSRSRREIGRSKCSRRWISRNNLISTT
jgi:CheY-like chemotaxis protein